LCQSATPIDIPGLYRTTNGAWEIDSSGGTCAHLHIRDAAPGDIDPS
jgi:hypothetical protein